MTCVRYELKAQMKWLQFSPKPMKFPHNLMVSIMLYNVIICIFVLFIYQHLGKIRDILREFRIKTENIYLWFRRWTFLSNFWISLSFRNLIIQLNFLLDTTWAPTNLFSTNSSSILDNSKSILANLTARSTSRGQVLIFSEIFAFLLLTESKNLVKFSVRMGSGFGNPDIILIQLFRWLKLKILGSVLGFYFGKLDVFKSKKYEILRNSKSVNCIYVGISVLKRGVSLNT